MYATHRIGIESAATRYAVCVHDESGVGTGGVEREDLLVLVECLAERRANAATIPPSMVAMYDARTRPRSPSLSVHVLRVAWTCFGRAGAAQVPMGAVDGSC